MARDSNKSLQKMV